MSMSKKDFIALADALKPVMDDRPGVHMSTRDEKIVDALCQFLHGQNPAFKEGRWRAYLAGECGPSGGAVKKEKPAHKVTKGADHWFCSCGMLFPNPGAEQRAKDHVYGEGK